MSSDYNMEENQENAGGGQDQTEGGAGEGGGEENNEADMIFAPEASKPGRNAGMLMIAFVMIGVGVIYFMRARGGPATALATPEVIKAEGLIKGFDNTQVKKMEDLLKNTQKVVEIFNGDRNAQHEDKKLERNPWVFVSPSDKGPTLDPNAADKAKNKAQVKFVEGVNSLR